MKTVKFKDWECDVNFAQYGNGRTAIQLKDVEDHSLIATASVNLPDEPLKDDEIAIRDSEENFGMQLALFDAGIVSTPLRWVHSGWIKIPICKLLVEVPE